jgi:hypothetical protein
MDAEERVQRQLRNVGAYVAQSKKHVISSKGPEVNVRQKD